MAEESWVVSTFQIFYLFWDCSDNTFVSIWFYLQTLSASILMHSNIILSKHLRYIKKLMIYLQC